MIIMLSASELTARIKAKALVDGKIASPGIKHPVTESSRKKLKFMGRQPRR